MMENIFDLVVIGGGSGGVAAARRAAKLYGKKVALIEHSKLGGTCVNLGCVPKKMMYNAASILESFHDASSYAFNVEGGMKLNWGEMVEKRETYIRRLNSIYESNLRKEGVVIINGMASFKSKDLLLVRQEEDDIEVCGRKVLIATGSHPVVPKVPGHEYGVTSDGFFAFKSPPRKVGIVGSGYVGVELAGILHTLGSSVTLWCRKDGVLSHFDSMIQDTLTSEMRRIGITINTMCNISSVKKTDNSLTVCFKQDNVSSECHGYDCLIWAIGRTPNTQKLNLANVGVELDHSDHILTDDYQNTSVDGIYAVGDVCGSMPLTPVAIAAGRKLIDRLFGGKSEAKIEYINVPTVVFSHPSPCGTIGFTESQARSRYLDIRVYESSFINLYYALHDHSTKGITKYKLICEGEQERIVGLHMIGRSSDEILQGFATAIKMGATKADFDNCVAIHPTAAEELVTMK